MGLSGGSTEVGGVLPTTRGFLSRACWQRLPRGKWWRPWRLSGGSHVVIRHDVTAEGDSDRQTAWGVWPAAECVRGVRVRVVVSGTLAAESREV
jgi:hypothetical protein